MHSFRIDHDELDKSRHRAAEMAANNLGTVLAERLRNGNVLGDEELGALLLSPEVDTDDLVQLATQLRSSRESGIQIETFSPLYITNHCDAECLMCGMRGANKSLQRSTADHETIETQLDILHQRGLRGVAILTGEYRHGALRKSMLARTAEALTAALDRGFTHVLINVGSIEEDEYEELLAGAPRGEDGKLLSHVTMCTFQEAYQPEVYGKFMGKTPENPRSDYRRRLSNFDRASEAGMRSANPGILLGLNRDLAYEMLALLAHVRHLLSIDMQVYISLPRLRKASGAEHFAGVSDGDLVRIVAILSAGIPRAKVVISTRERPEVQQRLLPMIGVLTAGSPGVAPYSAATAVFDVAASQFEVEDQRPIEEIMRDCLNAGAQIDGYEPAAPSPTPAS